MGEARSALVPDRARAATVLVALLAACASEARHPAADTETADLSSDLSSVPVDLVVPPVRSGAPRAGARVRMTLPEYANTDVHHVLYLPSDWKPTGRYPLLVEYAGNGPYRNKHGDVSTGRVADSVLGYGISAGRGFLWLCLPFVAESGQRNERRWWGDVQRTVRYCKEAVPRVCAEFGGDPRRVLLVGFSRGAIACNFIGLHDDEIATLWAGLLCHSHYDGVRRWPYPGSDAAAAAARLARLGTRPQWISHEQSVGDVTAYLRRSAPHGRFTVRALPFVNHTDTWVLRDVELRRELRSWVRSVLEEGAAK